MSTVDYYLVRPHPHGGYTAVPVPPNTTHEPEVSLNDWRFPSMELAIVWADSMLAPGGVSIHESCDSIGDNTFPTVISLPRKGVDTRLHVPVTDPETLDKIHRMASGEKNVWEEDEPAYTGVGQALFSNTRTYPHKAEWASEGIGYIADAIAKMRGDVIFLDASPWISPFQNDVFVMRPYCWCDGNAAGHEDGCPPNFEHFESGLIITWYQHARNGITSDRPKPDNWASIVVGCIDSVRAQAA